MKSEDEELRDTGSRGDLQEVGTQLLLPEHPEAPALLAS